MSTQVIPNQYRIVFRGQVLPGRRIEEVRDRATKRLQLPLEQLDVLFSGRKVFLKRRLDADRTKSYVRELLGVGMHVRIEREDSTVAIAVAKRAPAPVPAAAPIVVAPPPTPAAVAAVFDPTKTCTSLSATQFDNVLAAYAPGADEFDTPSSASPIVVPPSFTRPVLARIEEAARDSLITMAVERRVAPAPSLAAVTPPTNNAAATEIVPDRRIARRHPATEEAEAKLEQWRPEASLAERYAKHERQRARNMAKMQEESSRGEALLFLGGCAGLLLIWLFFA